MMSERWFMDTSSRFLLYEQKYGMLTHNKSAIMYKGKTGISLSMHLRVRDDDPDRSDDLPIDLGVNRNPMPAGSLADIVAMDTYEAADLYEMELEFHANQAQRSTFVSQCGGAMKQNCRKQKYNEVELRSVLQEGSKAGTRLDGRNAECGVTDDEEKQPEQRRESPSELAAKRLKLAPKSEPTREITVKDGSDNETNVNAKAARNERGDTFELNAAKKPKLMTQLQLNREDIAEKEGDATVDAEKRDKRVDSDEIGDSVDPLTIDDGPSVCSRRGTNYEQYKALNMISLRTMIKIFEKKIKINRKNGYKLVVNSSSKEKFTHYDYTSSDSD